MKKIIFYIILSGLFFNNSYSVDLKLIDKTLNDLIVNGYNIEYKGTIDNSIYVILSKQNVTFEDNPENKYQPFKVVTHKTAMCKLEYLSSNCWTP